MVGRNPAIISWYVKYTDYLQRFCTFHVVVGGFSHQQYFKVEDILWRTERAASLQGTASPDARFGRELSFELHQRKTWWQLREDLDREWIGYNTNAITSNLDWLKSLTNIPKQILQCHKPRLLLHQKGLHIYIYIAKNWIEFFKRIWS